MGTVICDNHFSSRILLFFFGFEDSGSLIRVDSSLTFRKDYCTLVLLGTEKGTKGIVSLLYLY